MAYKTNKEYRIWQAEEKLRIARTLYAGDGDRDILNLEYMIASIGLNSAMWKSGCVTTLRKAIKLIEKEKKASENV